MFGVTSDARDETARATNLKSSREQATCQEPSRGRNTLAALREFDHGARLRTLP
jgi:hypothetical protein